jgi:hypothetical protein
MLLIQCIVELIVSNRALGLLHLLDLFINCVKPGLYFPPLLGGQRIDLNGFLLGDDLELPCVGVIFYSKRFPEAVAR